MIDSQESQMSELLDPENIYDKEMNEKKIITMSFFKNKKRYYYISIDFSKDSKLELIKPSSFSNLHLYSITFPPNLKILLSDSLKGCRFLNQINFSKNDSNQNFLGFICDKAFADTVIESIVLPDSIKEIGSFCFPFCLKQVEFEKGAPNLQRVANYAFSNTRIESIKMPSNINTFVNQKNIFYKCKKLDTVIFDFYVDKESKINADYATDDENQKNDRMKNKEKFKEHIQKVGIYSKSGVSQDFARSLLLSQINIKNLEVFVSNINYFYFYNTPNLTSISIPKSDNAQFVMLKGCLYTKDKRKLIVAKRNIDKAFVNSLCKIISNYAFNFKSLKEVLFRPNSELQEISFLAFSESRIKKIFIPNNVDFIDYAAFYKCKKLETANIPRSLISIDFFTFSFTNLTKILIPRNVIRIGYGCFLNCRNLRNVTFEKLSNLIEIDDYAFACTKISSISIPKNVKRIGKFCFYGCNMLKTVSWDNDSCISEIGCQCFIGTKINDSDFLPILKKIDISQTREDIPHNSITFITNPNIFHCITQIFIPSKVEEINAFAFANCSFLTKVEIINCKKSKLNKISQKAFYDCSSLAEFKIPTTVNFFGEYCFKNCLVLSIKIKVVNDQKIVIGKNAFENTSITSFIAKSEQIKVNNSAFHDCKKLITFKTDANICCVIGDSVFESCTSLKDVSINPNVITVKIGKNCFMNSSIRSFIVPDNLTIIPKYCFKSCSKLSQVTINENSLITHFGEQSFSNSGLQQVFIPSQTKIINKNCFEKCKKLSELTFSKDLIECRIKERAFYMTAINNLCISSGIINIDSGCFEKCTNLKDITFPENSRINTINRNAFASSGIESLTIYPNIKSIKQSAFQNCTKLQKIIILGKKITIFPFAFSGCINLQDIQCKSIINFIPIISNSNLKNIYLIKITKKQINTDIIKVLFIGTEPVIQSLQFCQFNQFIQINDKLNIEVNLNIYQNKKKIEPIENLQGIYYTNCRKSIIFCDFLAESVMVSPKAYTIESKAFKYSSLKRVDFKEGSQLKKIEISAFENQQIEEISIPDTVIVIENSAFRNCRLLKKVNISSKSQLQVIMYNAFSNTAIESIFLPSTLNAIGFFGFYKCSKLTTVEINSTKIYFGYQSFSFTSIENILFPSNTTFEDESFSYCYKLKHIDFIEPPTYVKFGENSFSFSGIEKLNLQCQVEIMNKAFAFCPNLKQVILTGENIHCSKNAFDNSKVEDITLKLDYLPQSINASLEKTHHSLKYDIDPQIIKDTILFTYLKKLSLEVSSTKEADRINIYLNNSCFVANDELFYANMIDNPSLLTYSQKEEDIKTNEILKVPSRVKKLNFPTMTHIKMIQWPSNCIVDDLGPPGFFSYYNLVEIVIPKMVQKIAPHLFEHCHYLRIVSFVNGCELNEIGEFAFSNTCIEEIEIPDAVQIIKQSTFAYNLNLKKVTFNGEIIQKEAFLHTGITEFDLSNNTKVIESSAFQFCRSLKKFNIDIEKSALCKIGSYAFSETGIILFNIPKEVKIIKKFTFSGCENLKEVRISENSQITKISKYSFSGNLNLERINIPKSIRYLSHKAFINTPSLVSIMNESNQYFNVMKNNEIYSNDNSLVFVPRNLKQFEVKDNCSIIHSGAFCGPNLEDVIFSDNSLISIEECGFAHSTRLNKICLPNSIVKIENEAFIDCQNLEIVEFQPGCQLKEIPPHCFAFSGLKKINLPQSVEKISYFSFYLCSNLKYVNFSDINIKYIGDSAFSETSIEEIKFPHSIFIIEDHAFEGTKSLKSIDFSKHKKISDLISVEEIDSFHHYKKRMEIINSLPNDISSESNNNGDVGKCYIGQSCFYNSSIKTFKFNINKYKWHTFYNKCINIENIIINDNIKIFFKKLTKQLSDDVENLFGNIYKVRKLIWKNQKTIRKSEKYLNSYPIDLYPLHFFNTSRLIKIHLGDEINITNIPKCCFSFTYLKEIYISSSIELIDSSAFKYCFNLEKVTFSDKSKLNRINHFAFYGCKKLKSISIPNQVTIIPPSCFSFSGLTSFYCQNSIKIIESKAFLGCMNLAQIFLNEGLIKIGESSFENNISLEIIDLPDSLTTINNFAFANCSNLKYVRTTNRSQLVKIKSRCFENTKIEELKLNPSLKQFFEPFNVPKLTKISFYESNSLNFKQFEDGSTYEIINQKDDSTNLHDFISLSQQINNFNLMNSNVQELDSLSFKICTNSSQSYKLIFAPKNLECLRIQEGCISVGNSILNDMTNLTTIEYLKGKSNLILNFPNYNHFYTGKYNNIKHIKIMGNHAHIEKETFSNFESLESVEICKSTYIYLIPERAFCCCKKLQEIFIPSSCFIIEKCAFKDCICLQTVQFGSSKNKLQIIEKEAFYNCSALTNIVFPSSLLAICEGAFMNCRNLKSFSFDSLSDEKLEKIEKNAFKNCISLDSIVIPQACLTIHSSAFMNCPNNFF